jgi:hypothetical protein
MDEVIALEQKRLTGCFCERVSKAVTEIKFGGMPAALAEIAISLARNARLRFRYGLDRDLRFLQKIIEAPAGNRIAASL